MGFQILGVLLAGPAAVAAPAARPNILFIAIDDLNAWVRHLGRNEQVLTPNIDRLAARGVTFTNAHCPAPVCNPCRAALLSGLRPSTTGIYNNGTDWRPRIPESLTLLTCLRKNGYRVAGAGKIYHGGFERPSEWDEYMGRTGPEPAPKKPGGAGGIRFAPLDCRDEDMPDHRIASWVIERLGRKQETPFFLACGFHNPHMPWNVPRKYFDLYPLEGIRLPPVREDDLADLPRDGVRRAGAKGDHVDILASGRWKEAVRAYLAAITFVDAEVGRVIDALDESAYRDDTIVVLWGDNGFHLGEKLHWRKFALWEESTRVPFIWVAPGVTAKGGACRRPVDFMSVYPTLCDLAGVPIPSHVEGVSIRPLLADPAAAWDRPAITTFPLNCHAIRTEAWRYIRYADGGEELYDEAKDPFEWTNLAGKPEFAAVKADLAKFLPKANRPGPAAKPAGKKKAAGKK
ncbi:MAG: sulfatase [Planctomycetes bacterium]|nr:sulfatase [Planctomycetota bacterium]